MKKRLPLLLLILSLLGIQQVLAQYTQIPDGNFEAALEALGYDDISDDGQVPTTSIESITSLNVRNKNISSLTGIEDFIALTSLDVEGNSLITIDLSNNVALESLSAGKNLLTGLNVTANSNLQFLTAEENQLSTIDLSNNTALLGVDLRDNQLTDLDVSNCTDLVLVGVDRNNLLLFDLSKNPSVLEVKCTENNQLVLVNLKNGNSSNIIDVDLNNNPLLSCVLVDDATNIGTGWVYDNHTSFSDTDCGYTEIPDANFEAALDALGYDDISGDGKVPTLLIERVTSLDVNTKGISNLTGIEDFVALEILDIEDNNITTIDLSNNLQLRVLRCNYNNLTSLDLSANTNLTSLYCRDNQLTALDVSNNNSLEQLWCHYNNITSLDLSNNTVLRAMSFRDNSLTEIDLTNNVALENLFAQNNAISSVNLVSNLNLKTVTFANNTLTDFNIRNGNNTNITTFNLTGNTSLTCVEVDDVAYSTNNWTNIEPITSFTDVYCRYTTIPDANFEARLEALGYDDISGDGQVPTILIEGLTKLKVNNQNISDLTGIQDFVALMDLDASENNLSTINLSNNTALKALDLDHNNLTAIDLSNNTVLETFYIQFNALTILDISANSNLEFLGIEGNQLTNIDLSTNILLNYLNVGENQLTNLDVSNNSNLETLFCFKNNLTSLDLSTNSSLRYFSCSENNQLSFINLKNGNNGAILVAEMDDNHQLTCVLVDNATDIGNDWYYERHTSFSDTYCRYTAIPDTNFEAALEAIGYDDISGDGQVPTALIEEVTSLSINAKSITDMTGIASFTALQELYANANNFTTIDLSQNLNLEILFIKSGGLSTIDLSQNVSLTTVNVNDNQLTSIDLTNCTALESLDVGDNTTFLTALDVSTNVNLVTLEADNNNITTLDLSQNNLLENVNVRINQLSAIDLTNANVLYELSVRENNLTTLDLTTNVNLIELFAYENQLTSLDLTNNTLLESVNVSDNNLSSIDVSNCNLLTSIDVANNQLTTIDLSNNPLIETLKVGNNSLSNIDLRFNNTLEQVFINSNSISSIDLSNNLALQTLNVSNNNLLNLDLSKNVVLTALSAQNNPFTYINLANGFNTNITFMSLINNPDLACVQVDDATYSTTNWTSIDDTSVYNETSCVTSYPLSLKAFLQGAALNPASGEESLMRDDLKTSGYVPTTSPYTDALICDVTIFETLGNDAIVDWVWVELRDATDHTLISYSRSALLQRDGDIVDVDGASSLLFSTESDTYYMSIGHRNHLTIVSANPYTLSVSGNVINMSSDPATVTGGSNALIDMGNSVYAIPSGDYDENGQIQNSDINVVITTLGSAGYLNADMDMNGQVQNTDINNILNPNVGKGEQF